MSSGSDQHVGLASLDPADQVRPGQAVGPLVAAAHLQDAAVVPVQVEEVVGLEQGIVELQEVQPRLGLQLRPVGLHGQHLVDAEVDPDVPQELHVVQLRQPLGVVQHQGPALGEVQVALQLGLLPLEVLLDLLVGEDGRLVVLPVGSPTSAGAAAHQGDGPVAVALHPGQGHYLRRLPTWRLGAVGS